MKVSYRSPLAVAVFVAVAGCSADAPERDVEPAEIAAAEDAAATPMDPLALLDPEPNHGPVAVEESPIPQEVAIALNGSDGSTSQPAAEVHTTAAVLPTRGSEAEASAMPFTSAQANRGQQVQQKECAACHSPADWGQGRVLGNYSGATAYDLVDHLRMTMPMDGPGRLSLQEYTDIVAYMFQLNGIQAGSRELPADEAQLRTVRIEYRR